MNLYPSKGGQVLRIYKYSIGFNKLFAVRMQKLRILLGDDVAIEHVGSTAISGADGKGVVDILIGFRDKEAISEATDKLKSHGYFVGKNSGDEDRVFLASSEGETSLGDVHLHLAIEHGKEFNRLIEFRDYLRQNPEVAAEYSALKHSLEGKAGRDHGIYEKEKGAFIDGVLGGIKTKEKAKSRKKK